MLDEYVPENQNCFADNDLCYWTVILTLNSTMIAQQSSALSTNIVGNYQVESFQHVTGMLPPILMAQNNNSPGCYIRFDKKEHRKLMLSLTNRFVPLTFCHLSTGSGKTTVFDRVLQKFRNVVFPEPMLPSTDTVSEPSRLELVHSLELSDMLIELIE